MARDPQMRGTADRSARTDSTSMQFAAVGKHTLTSAISFAPQRTAAPDQSFAAATSGAGEVIPFRDEMERAFDQDFSNVQSYTGRNEAMEELGAEGAAHGEKVAFASHSPSKDVVAHELAHVVQGRRHGIASAPHHKERGVASSSHPAEIEADLVAGRVVAGERVDVHAALDAGIHLKPGRTTTSLKGGTIPKGASVEILQCVGPNVQIEYGGKKHWVPIESVEDVAPLEGVESGLEQEVVEHRTTIREETTNNRSEKKDKEVERAPETKHQGSSSGGKVSSFKSLFEPTPIHIERNFKLPKVKKLKELPKPQRYDVDDVVCVPVNGVDVVVRILKIVLESTDDSRTKYLVVDGTAGTHVIVGAEIAQRAEHGNLSGSLDGRNRGRHSDPSESLVNDDPAVLVTPTSQSDYLETRDGGKVPGHTDITPHVPPDIRFHDHTWFEPDFTQPKEPEHWPRRMEVNSGEVSSTGYLTRPIVSPPATFGYVSATPSQWPNKAGFTLLIETHHWKTTSQQPTKGREISGDEGPDRVSLLLRQGDTGFIDLPLVFIAAGGSGDQTVFNTQTIVNISYAELREKRPNLPIGNDVKLNVQGTFSKSGAPKSDKGHFVPSYFFLPCDDSAGVVEKKLDFPPDSDVELNLGEDVHPGLRGDYSILQGVSGPQRLTTSIENESEYMLPCLDDKERSSSEAALLEGITEFYRLANGKPGALGDLIGLERLQHWTLTPGDKYFLEEMKNLPEEVARIDDEDEKKRRIEQLTQESEQDPSKLPSLPTKLKGLSPTEILAWLKDRGEGVMPSLQRELDALDPETIERVHKLKETLGSEGGELARPGTPGVLTDTYFDTDGLDILGGGGSLRVRDNFRQRGTLTTKGLGIEGSEPETSSARFQSQIDAQPDLVERVREQLKLQDSSEVPELQQLQAIVNDPRSGSFSEALRSTGYLDDDGGKERRERQVGPLRPVLQVRSERHRFSLRRPDTGITMEISFDFSTGQLIGDDGEPYGDKKAICGFEIGLAHLGAGNKVESEEQGLDRRKGKERDDTRGSSSFARPPQPKRQDPPQDDVQPLKRVHDIHDLRHPSLTDPQRERNVDFLSWGDTLRKYFAAKGVTPTLAGFKPNQFMVLFKQLNGDPDSQRSWTDGKRMKKDEISQKLPERS